ncbi:MAG: hypothetical protein R2710_01905 [Acidimicrobiales bacterium]
MPQTIDLLTDGAARLDNGVTLDDLRAITYHQVIALLTKVVGRPDFGPSERSSNPTIRPSASSPTTRRRASVPNARSRSTPPTR